MTSSNRNDPRPRFGKRKKWRIYLAFYNKYPGYEYSGEWSVTKRDDPHIGTRFPTLEECLIYVEYKEAVWAGTADNTGAAWESFKAAALLRNRTCQPDPQDTVKREWVTATRIGLTTADIHHRNSEVRFTTPRDWHPKDNVVFVRGTGGGAGALVPDPAQTHGGGATGASGRSVSFDPVERYQKLENVRREIKAGIWDEGRVLAVGVGEDLRRWGHPKGNRFWRWVASWLFHYGVDDD